MGSYRIGSVPAISLAAACWLLATGLAAEKVLKDGIVSWTMLLAMPVLTAAVGVLIHTAVTNGQAFMVRVSAACLAAICLAVTLPASIGSSGGARDTALAEAKASNRAIEIAEGAFTESQRDLNTAKAGVLKECVGAPEVITDDAWPKCRWFRRAVAAYQAAMANSGRKLASAPAVKIADSGEQRVAWAVSAVASRWNYQVTAADVALVWPMLPPIAFELLCAFFMCAGLERRTVSKKAADPVVIEPVTAGEYVDHLREPTNLTPPTPPKSKKRSKRRQRRERVLASIRAHTMRTGLPPKFSVVRNRHRLPGSTAHRYLKQATA